MSTTADFPRVMSPMGPRPISVPTVRSTEDNFSAALSVEQGSERSSCSS